MATRVGCAICARLRCEAVPFTRPPSDETCIGKVHPGISRSHFTDLRTVCPVTEAVFDHPSPSWVCAWCCKFLPSGHRGGSAASPSLTTCARASTRSSRGHSVAELLSGALGGIAHAGSMMQICAQLRRVIDIRSLCPGPGETEDDAASARAARVCVRGLGCRKDS